MSNFIIVITWLLIITQIAHPVVSHNRIFNTEQTVTDTAQEASLFGTIPCPEGHMRDRRGNCRRRV